MKEPETIEEQIEYLETIKLYLTSELELVNKLLKKNNETAKYKTKNVDKNQPKYGRVILS